MEGTRTNSHWVSGAGSGERGPRPVPGQLTVAGAAAGTAAGFAQVDRGSGRDGVRQARASEAGTAPATPNEACDSA